MASSGSSKRKAAGSRAQTGDANTTDETQANTAPSDDIGDSGANTGSTPSDDNGSEDPLRAALSGLSHLVGDGGAGNPVTDAITQAVLLLLGTGPAVAAYQGLLSAQQANGEMFNQAVSNQQRLNLLGMCTTAKCVRYMFDGNEDDITDVEAMLNDAAKD